MNNGIGHLMHIEDVEARPLDDVVGGLVLGVLIGLRLMLRVLSFMCFVVLGMALLGLGLGR
jgi:hypothetical protein